MYECLAKSNLNRSISYAKMTLGGIASIQIVNLFLIGYLSLLIQSSDE